jgi:predicted glutamine amidotransferase
MCGIVGFVSKKTNGPSKKEEDSFYEMLYTDALRGWDSTGVVAVENTTTFHIAKEACEATFFNDQFRISSAGKDFWARGKAIIGHNRKKTMGTISDVAAHPFVIDNHFAMVHNGTLYNHKQLANTEVDSEALAIVLEKAFGEGKEALEEILGKVNGAYAVAAYDQRDNKIQLLRNKDRPLCLLETEDGWFWASEGMMAIWILVRNGYDLTKIKSSMCEENMLYSFDLDKNTLNMEQLTPKKYTAPIIQTHTPMVVGAKTTTLGLISGKAFKRMKAYWTNKTVEFLVDDYIEEEFPLEFVKGQTDNLLLMGTCDKINHKHTVYAAISAKQDFNITKDDAIVNRLWSGCVDDTENMGVGGVRIYLSDVKPVPLVTNVVTYSIEEYQREAFAIALRKMMKEDLILWYGKNKYKESNTWKMVSYNKEILTRSKYKDNKICSSIVAGVACLVDEDTGVILYENSIVVH